MSITFLPQEPESRKTIVLKHTRTRPIKDTDSEHTSLFTLAITGLVLGVIVFILFAILI